MPERKSKTGEADPPCSCLSPLGMPVLASPEFIAAARLFFDPGEEFLFLL